MKYHKQGGLKCRNEWSHSSGGYKAEIKVLVGSCCPRALGEPSSSLLSSGGGAVLSSPPVTWPSSPRVFIPVRTSAQISPLLRAQSCWIRVQPNKLILTWLPLWRPFFLMRSHSEALQFHIVLRGHSGARNTGNGFTRRHSILAAFRPVLISRPLPPDFPGALAATSLNGCHSGAAYSDLRSCHISC